MNLWPYFWFCVLALFAAAIYMVLSAMASHGWFDDGGDDE